MSESSTSYGNPSWPPSKALMSRSQSQSNGPKVAHTGGCPRSCAFTDPEQRIKAIGSVRQNLGDLLSATIRGGNNREVYGNFVDLMKRVPECCLVDVPCPPEGEADVILVGDSSIALVSHEPGPPGEKPQYSTINVGDLISKKKLPWMSTLTTAMAWGGGLADLLTKAAALTEEVVARNEIEYNGRRVIIFIAWSGNDVFSDGGYSGCRWKPTFTSVGVFVGLGVLAFWLAFGAFC